jgi:hypothetical protein
LSHRTKIGSSLFDHSLLPSIRDLCVEEMHDPCRLVKLVSSTLFIQVSPLKNVMVFFKNECLHLERISAMITTAFYHLKERVGGIFMGTGRTLNKAPRTRPIKSQAEKRRRLKVQRARLLKLGMEAAVVAKMQPEDVRKQVQHPAKVKKALVAKAAKASGTPVKKVAPKAKKAPAAETPAKAPVAKKPAIKKSAVKKPAAKKPAVKKPAVKKPAAKKAE